MARICRATASSIPRPERSLLEKLTPLVASISTHIDANVPAGSSVRPSIQFFGIELFQHVDHFLIQLAVSFAHLEEGRELLVIEIVLHGSRNAVDAFGLGMRRQVAERFLAIW